MPINLQVSQKCFTPTLYPYLFNYEKRWETYMGSAGSGKSYFITQKLLIKALNSKRKVLVCRRYGVTLRNSVFALFKDVIAQFKLTNYCKILESNMSITLPNGSQFIFIGLDDEQKLLSISGITDIFVEEVFEVNKDVVDQLDLRLRARVSNTQIYMAFNPISPHHWLFDFCEGESQPKSFFYSRTTFRDNPFLPQPYVDSLVDMYRTNPNKARIFCDGNWGADVDGLVYKNHRIEEFDIQELLARKDIEVRCGMDIGYTDPTAIVVSLYDKPNKTIYIIGEYYKRGQQLSEIEQELRLLGIGRNRVYVDSADPRAIDYLKRANHNVVPVKKGQGSVRAGVSYLQDHLIVVHKECSHTSAEVENFSYEKDKSTGRYIEDKYTHEFSHSMDALRYAYSDLYTEGRMRSTKLNLGI